MGPCNWLADRRHHPSFEWPRHHWVFQSPVGLQPLLNEAVSMGKHSKMKATRCETFKHRAPNKGRQTCTPGPTLRGSCQLCITGYRGSLGVCASKFTRSSPSFEHWLQTVRAYLQLGRMDLRLESKTLRWTGHGIGKVSH